MERNGFRVLAAAVALLLAGGVLASQNTDTDAIRSHVEYLASDELGGRLTGSEGAAKAAAYIVEQLRQIGVRPLPGADDYRLPFEFTAGVSDGGSELDAGDLGSWTGTELVQGLSLSDDTSVSGELVFAGYGLAIPESQGYPYDSYFGLDVEDKIVVVLRYFPEDVEQEARAVLSRYSGLRYKAMQAREHGAKGLIVVVGPRSPNAGEVVPMTAVAGSGIAAASVAGQVGEALFAAAGKNLEEVQAELDTGNPHITGFELGVETELAVRIDRERLTGHNVVGYLPGSDAGDDRSWVMVGAHYDHLGSGRGGSSLADKDHAGQIHNGADDNASGVAGVLAAAARLARMQHARNVAFAFWAGEELAAYVNFDMVGRSRDNKLIVQAVGTASAWPSLIERSNVPVGFDITLQDDPNVPTDSSAFNQAEVPTPAFFTGSHENYHRPSDDADTLNYGDLARVAQLGALVVHKVANLAEAPEFIAVASTTTGAGDRDSVRAFTGTIPDYASDIEGLLLGGVIAGGPADEAGLRKGDVIVELAGQTIANIYDYTYALDALKIDEPVEVVFLRGEERMEAMLVPRARQ